MTDSPSSAPRGIQLDEVVPWGRGLSEYRQMFGLEENDLSGRIIDCAGGPASFSAEVTENGGYAVSCDPIYIFTPEQLRRRIDETYDTVIEGTRKAMDGYHWERYKSPDELGQARMAAMTRFLEDFSRPESKSRYIAATLPELPIHDDTFDLALCSHFLFTYSKLFSTGFHIVAIREMLRIAREVRLFPLMNLDCTPTPHLEPVMEFFTGEGHTVEKRAADYRMQKGADHFLLIQRKSS